MNEKTENTAPGRVMYTSKYGLSPESGCLAAFTEKEGHFVEPVFVLSLDSYPALVETAAKTLFESQYPGTSWHAHCV
jgi:predicted metal-binding protein